MKKFLIILIAGAVLVAGWFFVSPLFIDRAVDEPFPDLETLTRAEVDAMDAEQRSEVADAMREYADTAPDKTMEDPMPSAPRQLSTGSFRDADAVHTGSGDATIYQLGDGGHLLRFENFRVTNGPALVVLLARNSNPQSAADVIDGGYVSLGELKGNVGSQNYTLPANIDVSEYGSVVIWCRLFDVLFSAANLDSAATESTEIADGGIRELEDGAFEAWSADRASWLEPEAFWLAFAESNGGLTWGRGPDYPPYAEVSERDFFMAETDQGPCLMEFFHERWRRANDVRRWNDRFNDYAGCPVVFD